MGNSVGKFAEFAGEYEEISEVPFVRIELSEEKEETIEMMYVLNQMELLLNEMERVVVGGESLV
jgi:hypothetical protein